jgi:hypothetical protein
MALTKMNLVNLVAKNVLLVNTAPRLSTLQQASLRVQNKAKHVLRATTAQKALPTSFLTHACQALTLMLKAIKISTRSKIHWITQFCLRDASRVQQLIIAQS